MSEAQESEAVETVVVRIYRTRWRKLKQRVHKAQMDGDSDFTIADAVEEAIKTGTQPLDKFLEEPA
jgi:hypothetical protein